jgi:ABC-type Fe3+/spermidine/putrescine transport system ATPase subunit
MSPPALRASAVGVSYGSQPILRSVDVEAGRGEVLAVLGPSGSGKTTVLFAVAGFVALESGTIDIAGTTVAGPGIHVPPERRDVAVVFQSYALWPHLTALETVAFPLRAAGKQPGAARAEAARLLEAVGIGPLAERRPAELSGGQQQRVGLARALARRAGLTLFDEPTAHLDAPTREAIQAEIAARRAESGAAAVYATHDAGEALAVADRVALLRDGRIVQTGSPAEVYERPADGWAAAITGPVSVLTVEVENGTASVGGTPSAVSVPGAADGPVAVAVRPDWASPGGDLPARVVAVWYRGPHSDLVLDTPAGRLSLRVDGRTGLRPGEPASWSLHRIWPLPG